ncbi:PH domain-containing protein [Bacillus sp. FJAT-27445]|uniref:PH domain-containing protein n=1 Tax=Bacillus sp. FJAT-27445 TaxID=1679166 RepID=UPI0009E7CE95|nr:PH domain-containing protein [Bacillus sp. FJAT-27445]
MFEPKRLHPIAAVANAIKQLKGVLVPFAAFLFLGSRTEWDAFYYIAAGIGIVAALLAGVLSWYRFTYRIEENELRLEYGIFIMKKRYIPLERIQSVDRSEGILQRLFGLVQIKIETAGGGAGIEGSEAVFSAISKMDASQLEEAISAGKGKKPITDSQDGLVLPNRTLYKMPLTTLFLMASTSGGVGVVISAVLAFFFQFEEFIPYKKVFKNFEHFASTGAVIISILFFVAFLAAWLIAIAGMMLKYGNFSIEKTEEEFVISRGLLEKRKITIPLRRIQAVQIIQNPVRELLGYAAVHLNSAGGSAAEKDSSRILILPMVRLEQVGPILGTHLQGYDFNTNLIPLPKRALGRYMFRYIIFTLPPAAVIAGFFQPWGYFALLVPAIAALWAYARYRAAGLGIEGEQLCLQYRLLAKTTVYLQKNKIQSLAMKESYFQRRKKLAKIDASAKSGTGIAGGSVQDVDSSDAIAIYSWFSRSGPGSY